MCLVSSHLRDHSYCRTEPSRSQRSTDTDQAAGSRKRRRQQEGSSSASEEPPERRLRLSPRPSTSAPQPRPEGVLLESDRPGAIQQPVWGDSQPFLSSASFDAVAETIMAWLTDSPYNSEM
ncbi:uncharacterized protein AB9X84_014782 [Acanthopagrus schlegelii]